MNSNEKHQEVLNTVVIKSNDFLKKITQNTIDIKKTNNSAKKDNFWSVFVGKDNSVKTIYIGEDIDSLSLSNLSVLAH